MPKMIVILLVLFMVCVTMKSTIMPTVTFAKCFNKSIILSTEQHYTDWRYDLWYNAKNNYSDWWHCAEWTMLSGTMLSGIVLFLVALC
jgi:hypothetical protein